MANTFYKIKTIFILEYIAIIHQYINKFDYIK